MLQTVLESAQIAAGAGHSVDGGLDLRNGLSSTGLIAHGQVINAQSGGVAVLNGDSHLVVGSRGIADLQGQALAVTLIGKFQIARLTICCRRTRSQANRTIGLCGKARQLLCDCLYIVSSTSSS